MGAEEIRLMGRFGIRVPGYSNNVTAPNRQPAKKVVMKKNITQKDKVARMLATPSKERLLVIVARSDWANVGYRLMESVNRYTDWNARVIVKNTHPFKYPLDIVASKKKLPLIKDLMKRANFVLYGSSCHYYPMSIPPNKFALQGIWHGGSAYRANFRHYVRNVHPKLDFVFAHRDLEGLAPGTFRLHAPYDTDKYEYIEKPDSPIVIGFSPSIASNKGMGCFSLAARELKQKFGNRVKIDLIKGLPYHKCIERKRSHHIFFDQLAGYHIPPKATHGYGVSLLEAAAHGAVCLGGASYPDTPIITVRNKVQIVNRVSYLINHPVQLKKLGRETRDWVHRIHGYEHMGNCFINVIEGK